MSILDVLRKKKAAAEKRSAAFSARKEAQTSARAEYAKDIVAGRQVSAGGSLEIQRLRDVYRDLSQHYYGSLPTFSKELNKTGIALWSRVEAARAQVGCSAEQYLTAQFAWFDKTFSTAPKLSQLATEAAIERAREYTGTPKRLVSRGKVHCDKTAMFRQAEVTVQQIMRAQMCGSREEFYTRFILTGLYALPAEFLAADPAYAKAKARK